MKKNIVFLTLATLLLAGCSVKELANFQDNAGMFPTFYASFDNNTGVDTKTYVDGEMKLCWTEDDRLSIFVGNTYNHEYKYDGETGANNGSFSAVSDPGFVAGEKLEANYAVYPYNASHEMDPEDGLSVVLPSVQKYAENSFGLGANTMVAVTEDKNEMLLLFKNLCGYVVVKLYGEGTVTSLKLEGNDGEKISGKASVQAVYGELPSVTMSEDATTSITLDCGEGVTLGTTAETATEFWFCVPPVTFSKGFTVTATKADGWQMIQSTSSSKKVVRNTKNALTPIKAVFNIPSTAIVPPNNEIWYRTIDNSLFDTNDNAVYGYPPFNVTILSNEYKNGMGVIKCSGAITLLNPYVFAGYFGSGKITELYLPETVEIIDQGAICNNPYLTTLNIPKHLIEFTGMSNNPNLRLFTGPNVSEDGRCVIIDGELKAFAPKGIKKYETPLGIKSIGRFSALWSDELEELIISEGVEIIGWDAVSDCHSLKKVIFPKSLRLLHPYGFRGCTAIEGFYGNELFHTPDNICLFTKTQCNYSRGSNTKLINVAGNNFSEFTVPEGIQEIENYAFEGKSCLKRITLPSSILQVGRSAFEGCNNLEGIYGDVASDDHRYIVIGDKLEQYLVMKNAPKTFHVPDNIKVIGDYAFDEAPFETITMGDQVHTIGGRAFQGCYNLKSITISANVKTIGEYELGYNPFYFCSDLEEIFFRAPIPPQFDQPTECGYNHLSFFVPEESLSAYLHSGWSVFSQYLKGYKYEDIPDITGYMSTDYSQDKKIHILQTAKAGRGIDVVLMGDAYSDRQIADGTYEDDMIYLFNQIFTEEPYKSFKDYFNVYYINVVSPFEGYKYNSALGGYFGEGTCVGGSDEVVFGYAKQIITEERMDDALLVVAMNSEKFAGTCYMYWPTSDSGDYGRGASISYFSKGNGPEEFAQTFLHEALGHGFAKLADEYSYEEMGYVPSPYRSEIQSQQSSWGWWKNVDFTSDPTQVKWSRLLSDERYANEGLGCFEGGLTYWSGVWRSTDNSIMRYNTGGFNAPSREAIWYRIHKLAYGESWQYNYEDFVAYDAINRTPAAQAASRTKATKAAAAHKGQPFQPLHEPVVIKRSWKEAVNNAGNNNSR